MTFQSVEEEPLRVLCAGKSDEFVRLVSEPLKQAGFAVAAELVQTPEQFERQLRAPVYYDLVVVEVELIGGWHGADALSIWKQERRSIPFVIVAPLANRDAAIEFIKRGATDYVLSMDLDRLPLLVWRASEAREAAQAASRTESELLSNIRHELRDSMTGILGMTEMALNTNPTLEQRNYLTTVKTSAESLLTTIDNLLDFAEIEARELSLGVVEFDLHESLGETAKLLATAAHRKTLPFLLDIGSRVPRHVWGDPERLRQTIVHLAGNAIKFTEHGKIVLKAETVSENEEGSLLHFTVIDTGMGIPREKQQLIFEAFSQADSSLTRKLTGIGLGLTISASLVGLMGGRIWVESEPGRGSEFHFTARFKGAM